MFLVKNMSRWISDETNRTLGCVRSAVGTPGVCFKRQLPYCYSKETAVRVEINQVLYQQSSLQRLQKSIQKEKNS